MITPKTAFSGQSGKTLKSKNAAAVAPQSAQAAAPPTLSVPAPAQKKLSFEISKHLKKLLLTIKKGEQSIEI